MVSSINWTERSITSYGNIIEYVRVTWGEAQVKKFKGDVLKRLKVLATQPYSGLAQSERQINIRQIVVNKRVILIYQIKPLKNRIDLLRFWNTYQNPQKLKAN